MNRVTRNKNYHLHSITPLPRMIIFRDLLLTSLAWGLALFLAWDFLQQTAMGLLHELDNDPLNDLDWKLFIEPLKISLFFSSTVIIFIVAWTINNLLLLMRTRKYKNRKTHPLQIHKEVQAYGCSEKAVRQWRKEKIITVSIDNQGQILETIALKVGNPP